MPESIHVHVVMSAATVKKIDALRNDGVVRTRTAAVMKVIEAGLKALGKEKA